MNVSPRSDTWTALALRRRMDAARRLPPLWCETCKVSYRDPDYHTCVAEPVEKRAAPASRLRDTPWTGWLREPTTSFPPTGTAE